MAPTSRIRVALLIVCKTGAGRSSQEVKMAIKSIFSSTNTGVISYYYNSKYNARIEDNFSNGTARC